MTKHEKKELFLQIIESWFDDKSEQINTDNCIGFYHYFLDCLEFEVQFYPENESGFHVFLYDFVDLLSEFPSHREQLSLEKDGLKGTMFNYCEHINIEKLNIFTIRLNELFLMLKDEYFL